MVPQNIFPISTKYPPIMKLWHDIAYTCLTGSEYHHVKKITEELKIPSFLTHGVYGIAGTFLSVVKVIFFSWSFGSNVAWSRPAN